MRVPLGIVLEVALDPRVGRAAERTHQTKSRGSGDDEKAKHENPHCAQQLQSSRGAILSDTATTPTLTDAAVSREREAPFSAVVRHRCRSPTESLSKGTVFVADVNQLKSIA